MITIPIILILIGYIFHLSFSGWSLAKFGITESISAIFYKLKELGDKVGKTLGRYFTVWSFLLPALILPGLMILSHSPFHQVIGIITCLGLMVVGAAPEYSKFKYSTWHYVGAFMAALGAFGWVLIENPTNYLQWGSFLGCVLAGFLIQAITKVKDTVYFLEQGCFIPFLTIISYHGILLLINI